MRLHRGCVLRGRHDGRGHDLAHATRAAIVIIPIVAVHGRKIQVEAVQGREVDAGRGLETGLGVGAEDAAEEVTERLLLAV